jgi:hypothetical protein
MYARAHYYVHQNLGLIDRILRMAIGVFLIAVPYVELTSPGASAAWWHGLSMAIAVYFCLTGAMGTDGVLKVLNVKTCDTSNRNQCGSLPFQIDAMLGNDPKPEDHTEHTLLHSHHAK